MTTLFHNGRFFQSGPRGEDHKFAECLLADADGNIIHVGSLTDGPIANAGDAVTKQDMQGRVVLPGFIDSHMHLLIFGQSLQRCDLGLCESLEDIRAALSAFAAEHPDVPRLMAKGWMHNMTDGQALASMIDDLDPRPVFIDSKDLHSTWCNTPALKELGVLDPMPDPEGGHVERDESGRATGNLTEAAAVTIVWPHIASIAPMHEKLSAIREAVRTYHASGYTGLIEMATDENVWAALQAFRAEQAQVPESERLPMRFACHYLIKPSKTEAENLAQVARATELFHEFNSTTSPDCRIAGIKVICDGIIDGCTAALTEPYTSNSAHPGAMWTLEELAPVVRAASGAGMQCALHAIGDAAIRTAIDALEHHAVAGPSSSTTDRRHRIEHLELASPEDAARLGALGITASIQAVHADPAILTRWPELLGEERCERAFAYAEFAKGGARLALGTDAPTAPHSAWPNLYTATTRRTARMRPGQTAAEADAATPPVNPHFALDLAGAVAAGTRGGAYSCFADGFAGSLEAGKRCDLAVVDMEWKAEALLGAKVKETWFGGKRVFQA